MTRTETKRWKEPVLVARTAVKESAEHDDLWWWKEFRVRPLSAADFDALVTAGKLARFADRKPFLIESRRVDGRADRTPTNPWEWSPWMTGDTPVAVIDEMLGDSSFLGAESLVPEHAALAAHVNALRTVLNAEWEAEKAARAAHDAVGHFKDERNREFANKTAGKDAAATKKVEERMLKRHMPRLTELRADAKRASDALDAARAAVKAVRSAAPKFAVKER